MTSRTNTYIYAPDKHHGYGFTETGEEALPSELSVLLTFCKSISWRPSKLDHSDLKCMTVIQAENRYWVTLIEEGDADQYGRPLTLRVTSSIYDKEVAEEKAQDLLSTNRIDPNPTFNSKIHNHLVMYYGDVSHLVIQTHVPHPSPPNKRNNDKHLVKAKGESTLGHCPRGSSRKKGSIMKLIIPLVLVVSIILNIILWRNADALNSKIGHLKSENQNYKTAYSSIRQEFRLSDGTIVDFPQRVKAYISSVSDKIRQEGIEDRNLLQSWIDAGARYDIDSPNQLKQKISRLDGKLTADDRYILERLNNHDALQDQINDLKDAITKFERYFEVNRPVGSEIQD